jgi:uncharacterized protein YceH (UPF0502 family)
LPFGQRPALSCDSVLSASDFAHGLNRKQHTRPRARLFAMDVIAPWLTPALLVALFAWLRNDVRELRRELSGRIDALSKDVAELRERMAKLEGSLDGFLAGRRDRDVA